MLPESVVALVSWGGGVFFDFGGGLVTGFNVLDEKMSSLKKTEVTQYMINMTILEQN